MFGQQMLICIRRVYTDIPDSYYSPCIYALAGHVRIAVIPILMRC